MGDGQRGEARHPWGRLNAVKPGHGTVLRHTNAAFPQVTDQLIGLVIGGTNPGRQTVLGNFPSHAIAGSRAANRSAQRSQTRLPSGPLSISPRKLWDLTSRHEIPSLKIGRCVRYRVADLHIWTEKQSQILEA